MRSSPVARLRVTLVLAAALSAVTPLPADASPPTAYAVCLNCHSPAAGTLSKAEAEALPRLGGQQPRYLVAALDGYRRRLRDHFFMRGMALGLNAAQEAEIVTYLSALPATPVPTTARTRPVPPPTAALRCVACHGDATRPPAQAEFPRLAGQHAPYLMAAFRAYAERRRLHAVMGEQARTADGPSLTERELEAVAQWYAGLPGLVPR